MEVLGPLGHRGVLHTICIRDDLKMGLSATREERLHCRGETYSVVEGVLRRLHHVALRVDGVYDKESRNY